MRIAARNSQIVFPLPPLSEQAKQEQERVAQAGIDFVDTQTRGPSERVCGGGGTRARGGGGGLQYKADRGIGW